MRFPARLAALLCLAAPLSADVILTMKSGERYELPKPAAHRSGMVSFKTKDGRFLTVKQSEVAREETVVPPPPSHKIDRTDTKQLGAVAREQREQRGIDADVAGRPTAKPETTAAPPADTDKPSAEKKAEKKKPHSRKTKKAEPPPPAPPAAEASEPH